MAGRKVLVFYAYQEPKSLNGSLKNRAVEELSKQGCNVIMSDLYTMRFEPRATRNDIIGCLHNSEHVDYGVESWEAYKRRCLTSDLIEEQKKVQEAKLVIFQFPLYWFSMPAIMKDWTDRVLVQGFAHNFPQCYGDGLLKLGGRGEEKGERASESRYQPRLLVKELKRDSSGSNFLNLMLCEKAESRIIDIPQETTTSPST
nr:ribosyldihydronicotinamide dehydrogenase [quinone] [Chelonoidis abingdonii]